MNVAIEEERLNVTKRVLASLDMAYAVCAVRLAGETHFLAATETRGPCLLFSPPNWDASLR